MAGKTALVQVEDEVGSNGNVEEVTLAGQDLGSLEEMFSDLETSLENEIVISGLPDGQHGPEDQQIAAGRAVQNDELRIKALEELEETAKPLSDESKLPQPQSKKAPITKRISTMGMKKSEALASALGESLDNLLTVNKADLLLTEEAQFDKRLALLDAIDTLPIKIGEKATNLYAHVAKGAQLSNYTRLAINLLVADGEMTSKSLKDFYIARPYSEGTASSQATQMMKLLPLLGIARREGGKLVPDIDSTLLPLLTALPEPEVEAA